MRIGFRCDAGHDLGVGHLLRCLALGEEVVERGDSVLFIADVHDVPWAAMQLADRRFQVVTPADSVAGVVAQAEQWELDAVVLDGYHLGPSLGAALRHVTLPTLAMVDGAFGADQIADLYVDQNLGADTVADSQLQGGHRLAGLDFVLLRNQVRDRRPPAPPPATEGVPDVLIVLGGTDPHGAAEPVLRSLLSTGAAVGVKVIAARDEIAQKLRSVPVGPGQKVDVLPPVDDLPAMVTASDLAVTATGTSVWEMLCLGTATGVVCAADNQAAAYHRLARAGLALPLGNAAELVSQRRSRERAAEALRDVLEQPARRAILSARAWDSIDGRGRERVVDELMALLEQRTSR